MIIDEPGRIKTLALRSRVHDALIGMRVARRLVSTLAARASDHRAQPRYRVPGPPVSIERTPGSVQGADATNCNCAQQCTRGARAVAGRAELEVNLCP